MRDKLLESLQILSVEFHVIVSSPFHPQRLHGALAALVQRQAVGKVDDFVVRAVDHQNRRGYLWNLVNAMERVWKTIIKRSRDNSTSHGGFDDEKKKKKKHIWKFEKD